MIFGTGPNPSHRTSRGATATIGVTLTATARGNMTRSAQRALAISAAAASPTTLAMSSPPTASTSVTSASGARLGNAWTNRVAIATGDGTMYGGVPVRRIHSSHTAAIPRKVAIAGQLS